MSHIYFYLHSFSLSFSFSLTLPRSFVALPSFFICARSIQMNLAEQNKIKCRNVSHLFSLALFRSFFLQICTFAHAISILEETCLKSLRFMCFLFFGQRRILFYCVAIFLFIFLKYIKWLRCFRTIEQNGDTQMNVNSSKLRFGGEGGGGK